MQNPISLPKDLPINLIFIRMRFKFLHRMLDESFDGHLGYVSQFILKEMRRGTSLEAIRGVFPFNIQPVIEHLRQALLLADDILTELGYHYGFCLDVIQDSEFYGWVHWGNEIKILLFDDFEGLTDVQQDSESTYQVWPNFKGERPFASLAKQEKIKELMGFICPQYECLNPKLREKDIWSIRVAPTHTKTGEKEAAQCMIILPAQTMCAEHGIPLLLPVMERLCAYEPVRPWEGHFPLALPEKTSEKRMLCLLTGQTLDEDEETHTSDSYPKMAWPKEDWITEIPSDIDDPKSLHPLMRKEVEIALKWRVAKLGVDKIQSSFFHTFPDKNIWTPTVMTRHT